MSKQSAWSRLRTRDRLLIILLLPVWLVTLVVHLDIATDNALRRPAIFFSDAEPDGYPRIAFIAGGAETVVDAQQLKIGDELLKLQDMEMSGVSGVRAGILSFTLIKGDTPLAAQFRRGTETIQATYPFIDFGIPWWWPTLFGLSFGTVGFLILWRAPESRAARALMPAFVSFAITWQVLPGKSEAITLLGMLTYACAMLFAGPLLLRAIMLLPEKSATQRRWAYQLPWIFALMAITGTSIFFGFPLNPPQAQALHFGLITLFYLSILLILARNYYRADKLGRRQLRWILLGFYFAFVPAMLVTAATIILPDSINLYALSSLGMPIIPIMFLIAIAQYNLFDIDRIIGGSVSYSLLVIIVAVVAEAFIEPLVAFMGTRFGYDGDTVQVIFVAALTAVLIPIQRRWRPHVDRMFFAEGLAVEEAVDALIEKLEGTDEINAVERIRLLGHELANIYQFEEWAVFTTGVGIDEPQRLLGSTERIQVDGDTWSRYQKHVRPRTETLADANRYLVAPIRPSGELEWLLVLGPKESGDVYTPTDSGLIASVVHIVAMEISEHNRV